MKFGEYVQAAKSATEAANNSAAEAADLAAKAALARTQADHDSLASITANTAAVTALTALGGFAADPAKSIQYTVNGGSMVISQLVTPDTEVVVGTSDSKPGAST